MGIIVPFVAETSHPGDGMTNNDILRRVRYIFDLGDDAMIRLFALSEREVTRAEVSSWLKKDEDPDFRECQDIDLATFLNGMIIDRRGRREGPLPVPETYLTNNLILTKLKIALSLSSDDIIAILALADYRMSKHELSALFRKPTHRSFRPCLNQMLRNFLAGLQLKHRP